MVFPMHVGVFPVMYADDSVDWRLPHARGGVSSCCFIDISFISSSPCTWGCFQLYRVQVFLFFVFPMHVGVFPPQTVLSVS